eukprot:1180022-Prorocentrum_minimum.AAC.1
MPSPRPQGEWKADKRHGYGVCYFADGEKFRGEWEDDMWVQSSADPEYTKGRLGPVISPGGADFPARPGVRAPPPSGPLRGSGEGQEGVRRVSGGCQEGVRRRSGGGRVCVRRLPPFFLHVRRRWLGSAPGSATCSADRRRAPHSGERDGVKVGQ